MALIAGLDAAFLGSFLRDLFPAISGSISSFGPEIQVTAAVLAVFVADLFLPRRLSKHLAWVALAACMAPAATVLALWNDTPVPVPGHDRHRPLHELLQDLLPPGTRPRTCCRAWMGTARAGEMLQISRSSLYRILQESTDGPQNTLSSPWCK